MLNFFHAFAKSTNLEDSNNLSVNFEDFGLKKVYFYNNSSVKNFRNAEDHRPDFEIRKVNFCAIPSPRLKK